MSNVRHPTGHEESDVDPRLLAALALGIAVFLMATPFMLLLGYSDATRSGTLPSHLPQPPAPRLQTDPRSDLDRLRSYERGELDRFGWADSNREFLHIPIDRAMQLLIERGLPGWPSTKAVVGSNSPAPR